MLLEKGFTRRVFLAGCLLLMAGTAVAEDADSQQAAEQAAKAWLELVENGQYGETWDQTAAFFREVITRDAWIAAMVQTREPLGAVNSREQMAATFSTEIPDAPEGEYWVLQFKTAFAERAGAAEVVALKLEDSGWKTAGYFIR